MWNPLIELLFHERICGAFEPFGDETDLARIALSCHFALDLLCDKKGAHDRYPFLLADACVSLILAVNHLHCMHDHPNTACQKT